MRALFDRRGRVAACRQGAREASELNPTLAARQSGGREAELCALTALVDGQVAHAKKRLRFPYSVF
jgi:hypothetical protein